MVSDTIEDFKALRNYTKEARALRNKRWNTELWPALIKERPERAKLERFSEHHFRVHTRSGYLDYWPASGKYNHLARGDHPDKPRNSQGKFTRGTFDDLEAAVAFIKANW